MRKMKNEKELKVKSTERNKGIEPMRLKNGIVFGYDPEIHDEDAIEFTYKLPLGAIKRFIKSYMQSMKSIDQTFTYSHDSGSYEIRMYPYCVRMLLDIEKQLNEHKLCSKKIVDEVYSMYFKDAYEKMKRFSKNHKGAVMEEFKPCNDPECCVYTNNIFIKFKVFWKFFRNAVKYFKGPMSLKGEPVMQWVKPDDYLLTE